MPDEDERFLSSELRQGAGRDWVEEAAEDERLTELLRRRRMSIADLARDVAHRGDRMRAETAGRVFSGVALHTGDDYVTLGDEERVVEVALDLAVVEIERSESPPPDGVAGGSQTFKARLSEYAGTGEKIELVLATGAALVGSIRVVAVDHLEFSEGDRTVVVPLRLVAAVVRANP